MGNKNEQATAYVVCARKYERYQFYTTHILCVASTLAKAKARLNQEYAADKATHERGTFGKGAVDAAQWKTEGENVVFGFRGGTRNDCEHADYYVIETDFVQH